MRLLLTVIASLVLAGCDTTPSSVTTTPSSVDSPFVVVASTTGQTAGVSPSTSSSLTIPSNVSNPTVTSVGIDMPSPIELAPTTANPAWQLYDSLRNVRSDNTVDSFWACSTQQEDGTFRIQFRGQEHDATYDVVNDNWGSTSARIESDTNDYDAPAQGVSGITWRVETIDSIVFSSTRSEFSASNLRFNSIRFDQARTRFSAIDSQGIAIACARVANTSTPLCSYGNPYGGCVLAPIGSGDDAIKVVRTFAPTLQIVNGNSRSHVWNNFWQCTSAAGLEPFRFYFTGNEGVFNSGSLRQASDGVGWRYDYEGGAYRDNALSWSADALGSVLFNVETGSYNDLPLQSTSWTMFNIQPATDGQSFTASDSRGFDFSCERLVESGSILVPGKTVYRPCFHAPSACPVSLP